MASPSSSHIRSLYRRILRELPARKPSILSNPSSVQQRIRTSITSLSERQKSSATKAGNSSHTHPDKQVAAAEQFVRYLAAQRQYTTLVERYNPGMNMDEEERVRLTARRVGMNLPIEFLLGQQSGGEGGKGGGLA